MNGFAHSEFQAQVKVVLAGKLANFKKLRAKGMSTCDFCDLEKPDVKHRAIQPQDEQGHPVDNVHSLDLFSCDQCFGDIRKADSVARKKLDLMIKGSTPPDKRRT